MKKMAKLDVELGKAVGIQRTKAGSGDKEEAFLIRSTLLKFAGAFCLVFLVVGGLAIFLSRWEVSFQQGINLDERVEHEAVEQEAFTQFLQVGNLLTTFLRGEMHQKQTVQVVEVQVTKAVDELLNSIASATSSDDVQAIVEAFSDKIYGVLDEYSDMVGDESERAKDLLSAINNLMAEDDVMPESREKIRPVQGARNSVARVVRDGEAGPLKGGEKAGVHAARAPRVGRDGQVLPDAKARLAALGGDLSAVIQRVFGRVAAMDKLAFPEPTRDALTALQSEVGAAMAMKKDLHPFLQRFENALKSPGVHGVDVPAATSSDRQMVMALKDIVQLFPVMDNADKLQRLKQQWEGRVLNEGEVMHALHKLTRDHILPFEWVTGRDILGGGRVPPAGAAASRGAKGALHQRQHQQKYQWWSGLKEE